jgi:hypothetical protein
MHDCLPRRFSANPSDVDAEAVAGRRTGGQLQNMELAARGFQLIAEAGSGFLVVGREVACRVDYFLFA